MECSLPLAWSHIISEFRGGTKSLTHRQRRQSCVNYLITNLIYKKKIYIILPERNFRTLCFCLRVFLSSSLPFILSSSLSVFLSSSLPVFLSSWPPVFLHPPLPVHCLPPDWAVSCQYQAAAPADIQGSYYSPQPLQPASYIRPKISHPSVRSSRFKGI